MLVAGDTFRAAAVEQLGVWAERAGARFMSRDTGADPAALAFDALKTAQQEGVDIVFMDTAGRLQNRKELMEELAKIVRVMKKVIPDAPHATLLVLDATTGQNAMNQVEVFRDVAGVTGLVMTKLDGTARGGRGPSPEWRRTHERNVRSGGAQGALSGAETADRGRASAGLPRRPCWPRGCSSGGWRSCPWWRWSSCSPSGR